MKTQRIVSTAADFYGDETPTAILKQEGGLFRLWQITRHEDDKLRPVEEPISRKEIRTRFGKEALYGFEAPTREQLIFDAFGVEAHELEKFIELSYRFGIRPIRELRRAVRYRRWAVVVEAHDPMLPSILHDPEYEADAIFVIYGNGGIAVEYHPDRLYTFG